MSTPVNSESKKEATGPVISGGHLVATALKNEGVAVIWTLCGGHIIDIYDGCIDEGIKIIDVRHEQVAAHAERSGLNRRRWRGIGHDTTDDTTDEEIVRESNPNASGPPPRPGPRP